MVYSNMLLKNFSSTDTFQILFNFCSPSPLVGSEVFTSFVSRGLSTLGVLSSVSVTFIGVSDCSEASNTLFKVLVIFSSHRSRTV
ncbi:hypothetical protein MPTK1_Vg00720 [Marchantia polymorpha subsp. ruderalis]|uniref:Uncharacterized protein n=1 Tax=Marchantia polymorpha TaxID=3197 RepID=A0A2R6VX45_MARPO|nr:hypothetical protein MARPO_YA0046 [Marchantia polymorpha]BBN20577.1 hypothetical protein Mp_Vg00720 [Marchantia polymorpha subsp. ruderalis]|eukprot:PTQ26181.1 hypothetical protein MARPO_YA0046 [Marchantia polymorpha]